MPLVYVGNPTEAVKAFVYQVIDEQTPSYKVLSRPRTQVIPPRSQKCLTGNLKTEDVEHLIRSNNKYGFVAESEVFSTKGAIPTIFSLDKPISQDKLNHAWKRNMEVKTELGKTLRKEAAMCEYNRTKDYIRDAGLPGKITVFESSVIENTDSLNPNPTMNEVIQVSENAPEEKSRSGRWWS